MSEQTADFIANGREYIETHDWTQHELFWNDAVCAVGGLVLGNELPLGQVCDDPRLLRAYRAVAQAIPEKDQCCGLMGHVHKITEWNDQEHRTKQQVLDLFAKAEKIERAGYDPDA